MAERGSEAGTTLRGLPGPRADGLSPTEASLLAELEALGREVARAKSEIAALRVEDIAASHIPAATDELDAIPAHTAEATNRILDCCEALSRGPSLPAMAASQAEIDHLLASFD